MEIMTSSVFLKNYTYSDYMNDVYSNNPESRMHQYIGILVVFSVLCLLGILGNALVIWFGIFRMKKTVNVVWFLSLAVADFSFLFIFLLIRTHILLTYWLFPEMMCKLNEVSMYFNVIVNVLQITVISIDRCICVVFPVWCHNHRRPRLAYIIVIIIWIIPLAVAIPYIIKVQSRANIYMTSCVLLMNYSTYVWMKMFESVFLFLLPFIIIVSCYTVIVLHIRRRRSITSSRPLKTSVAVILVFFFCWFPINLYFHLFSDIGFYLQFYLSLIGPFLMVLNSCINPILYVFIGQDFKERFCGSLQDNFEKAFIE